MPHEVVYVFDEGDAAPDWLAGSKVSASEALTIYQAWNVALSLVRTPFVMNLNLDDRLAPNAIELLQNVLEDDPEVVFPQPWTEESLGAEQDEEHDPDDHGRNGEGKVDQGDEQGFPRESEPGDRPCGGDAEDGREFRPFGAEQGFERLQEDAERINRPERDDQHAGRDAGRLGGSHG